MSPSIRRCGRLLGCALAVVCVLPQSASADDRLEKLTEFGLNLFQNQFNRRTFRQPAKNNPAPGNRGFVPSGGKGGYAYSVTIENYGSPAVDFNVELNGRDYTIRKGYSFTFYSSTPVTMKYKDGRQQQTVTGANGTYKIGVSSGRWVLSAAGGNSSSGNSGGGGGNNAPPPGSGSTGNNAPPGTNSGPGGNSAPGSNAPPGTGSNAPPGNTPGSNAPPGNGNPGSNAPPGSSPSGNTPPGNTPPGSTPAREKVDIRNLGSSAIEFGLTVNGEAYKVSKNGTFTFVNLGPVKVEYNDGFEAKTIANASGSYDIKVENGRWVVKPAP